MSKGVKKCQKSVTCISNGPSVCNLFHLIYFLLQVNESLAHQTFPYLNLPSDFIVHYQPGNFVYRRPSLYAVFLSVILRIYAMIFLSGTYPLIISHP